MRYRAFGLQIDAAVELPGFAPGDSAIAPDFRVLVGSQHQPYRPDTAARLVFASRAVSNDNTPVYQVFEVEPGVYSFRYVEVPGFVVRLAEREVHFPGSVLDARSLLYFSGHVLGFLQRWCGLIPLHGSAVEIAGRAVIFLGPVFAGKSTLAGAFARRGVPVLTDDVAAVAPSNGHFTVAPGRGWVLLRPRSVAALWGQVTALPQITPGGDRCFLDLHLPGYRFAADPAPLGMVYVCSRQATRTTPVFHPLKGAQRLVQLVSNTYGGALRTAEQSANEFEVFSRLVKQVPVRAMGAADDLDQLCALCHYIEEDARRAFGDLPESA